MISIAPRQLLLGLYRVVWWVIKRGLFRMPPDQAHESALRALSWLDRHEWTHPCLALIHEVAFEPEPTRVGGVELREPYILAAGMVKGRGFDAGESGALRAVYPRLIPGCRVLPLLAGAVEFGSFTRSPRSGNGGSVLWRDPMSRSIRNRVGLRNPGVLAAASFLAANGGLPECFGISIALTPELDGLSEQLDVLAASVRAFLNRDLRPSWFTLNLSCPNTEGDALYWHHAVRVDALCAAALKAAADIPVWVKVAPGLEADRYRVLAGVFRRRGIPAVIATNTLRKPEDWGGASGDLLRDEALRAARIFVDEGLDVIASGGVLDGASAEQYRQAGVKAYMYYSALVFRGLLAAALIQQELKRRPG